MTWKQLSLLSAVKDDKAAVLAIYESLGNRMEMADTVADVDMFSRMRLAVFAIGAVRWGHVWCRD